MKILHIFKKEPSSTEAEIINIHSRSFEVSIIKLYEDGIDYDNFVKEVFSHDKVFCW